MGRDRKNERRGGRFVRYDTQLLDAPSWKTLSGNAVKLHLALIRRAFGAADGLAFLSEREACDTLGISSRDTVRRAFASLEKAGFIALEVPHALGVNGYGRAARWRLTHLPHGGKSPTRDFAKNAESLPKIRAKCLPKKQAMRAENDSEHMAQKLVHEDAVSLPKKPPISKTLPEACTVELGEQTAATNLSGRLCATSLSDRPPADSSINQTHSLSSINLGSFTEKWIVKLNPTTDPTLF